MDSRSRWILSKGYDVAMLSFAAVTTLKYLFPAAVPVVPAVPAFAGNFTFFVIIFGWPLLWLLGSQKLAIWDWTHAGREASLTPGSAGLFGISIPDLEGTVSGRTVRVQSKGEYVSVLTELESPHEAGAIVGYLNHAHPPFDLDTYATRSQGNVSVLASDDSLADELLAGRSSETLAKGGESECTSGIYVGNIADVFQLWDIDEKRVVYRNGDEEGFVADSTEGDILTYDGMDEMPTKDYSRAADADTVVLLAPRNRVRVDGPRLRVWSEAVVAIADAFEVSGE